MENIYLKVIVFDLGGTLMEYKNMPLSWETHYHDAFIYVKDNLMLDISDEDIEISIKIFSDYNPRIKYREIEYTPVFIGDEEKDIKTALNAGCKSVLINRNEEPRCFRQDFSITSLNELFEILKNNF